MSEYLSFSQISSYLSCGERYRLERIEKVEVPDSWWFIGGRAVHSTIEEVVQSGNYDTDEIFTTFFNAEIGDQDKSQIRASGKGEGEEWWRSNGPEMVKKFFTFLDDSPYFIATLNGKPAVEIGLTGEFGGVPVRGYADLVLGHEETLDLTLADIKTGATAPKFPLQLGIYARLMELNLGVRVRKGAYFMARKGELTTPVDLDQYTDETIALFTQKVNQAKELGLYLPNPGMFCGSCAVKDRCRVGHLITSTPPKKQSNKKPLTVLRSA